MVSLPLHCEVYVGVLVIDEMKENGGIMFRVNIERANVTAVK